MMYDDEIERATEAARLDDLRQDLAAAKTGTDIAAALRLFGRKPRVLSSIDATAELLDPTDADAVARRNDLRRLGRIGGELADTASVLNVGTWPPFLEAIRRAAAASVEG